MKIAVQSLRATKVLRENDPRIHILDRYTPIIPLTGVGSRNTLFYSGGAAHQQPGIQVEILDAQTAFTRAGFNGVAAVADYPTARAIRRKAAGRVREVWRWARGVPIRIAAQLPEPI